VRPIKERVGVDIFIDYGDGDPSVIAKRMQTLRLARNQAQPSSAIADQSMAHPIPTRIGAIIGRAASRPTANPHRGHMARIIEACERVGFDVIKTEGCSVIGEPASRSQQGQ